MSYRVITLMFGEVQFGFDKTLGLYISYQGKTKFRLSRYQFQDEFKRMRLFKTYHSEIVEVLNSMES